MSFKTKTQLYKSDKLLSVPDLNEGDLVISPDHHGISLVTKYKNKLYRSKLQNTNIETKLNRGASKSSNKTKITKLEVSKGLILKGSSRINPYEGAFISYDGTSSGITLRYDQAYTTASVFINSENTLFDGDVHIGNSRKLCFDGYVGESDGTYDGARPIKQTYIWEDGIDNLEFIVGNVSMMTMYEGVSDYISIPVITTMTNVCSITSTTADQLVIKYDGTNLAKFDVSSSGDLEIETVGAGTTDSDIILNADGHVEFGGCAAGFDRILAVDAANVAIDFRTGNKAHLDMTGGSISGTLTLQFPATSGNFVLVVQQDGSTRTIAAYATKDSAGNAGDNDGGTAGKIRWQGGDSAGSNPPDLTDAGNKRDVLSFYWDADEEVCYGVASLDF